jgi:hypothetical protein
MSPSLSLECVEATAWTTRPSLAAASATVTRDRPPASLRCDHETERRVGRKRYSDPLGDGERETVTLECINCGRKVWRDRAAGEQTALAGWGE